MTDPRVVRGVAVMDHVATESSGDVVSFDWRDQIDLNQLDVASIRWCVVGQVLNVVGHDATAHAERADGGTGLGWHAALDLLGAPAGVGDWSSPARADWTLDHGFDYMFDKELLTDEWRRYLVAHRASTSTEPTTQEST